MCLFKLKMHPEMRLAAGLCQDPLGEITALPRPPSWIQGVTLLRGREGKMHPILYPDLGGTEAPGELQLDVRHHIQQR